MSLPAFRNEERIGLFVAIVAHVALFAWLAWQKPAAPLPPPERMTVALSDTVGLTATAPNPAPEAAPDKGPDLGEPAPSPEPAPVTSATCPSIFMRRSLRRAAAG